MKKTGYPTNRMDNPLSRKERKREHLFLALKGKSGRADFSDIHLINNCLPELDLGEVNLKTTLAGFTLESPLFINAITGGISEALRINRSLARVAREAGLSMAVGSQAVALDCAEVAATFEVVRKVYPGGIIWANLGSYATLPLAQRAVDMIGADGLQLHLNVPQELAMKEGDCSFRGCVERIHEIAHGINVPVMVKEVGFGIAREQALQLQSLGVSAIDTGGKGGTNFMLIEKLRNKSSFSNSLANWGISTAISVAEVVDAVGGNIDVVATGGMTHSIDIAKALALGANAAGIAGMSVRILVKQGEKALLKHIKQLEKELRWIMLMTGSTAVSQLRKKPVVITGAVAEWLERRGVEVNQWARR